MAREGAMTRCWALWLFCYWPCEQDSGPWGRVVACQLERGHRGEHLSDTDIVVVSWRNAHENN